MKSNILLPLFLVFYLISCKKANERSCLKNAGEPTTKKIELKEFSFEGFSIFDNINITLISDTVDYALITSYENKIDFISFEQVDSLIEIRDLNKCNILRKHNKQTSIELHYKSLTVLSLNGNGKITSLSPIENEVVHIYALSSNSDINLEVNAASYIMKLVNGTLSGIIKGEVENSNIFHSGISNVNFEELKVENLRLTNKSDADVYLGKTNSLSLDLLSLGNIYYKGNPTIAVLENRFGSEIVNNN